MAEIISIGKIERQNDRLVLTVDRNYRNGLKGIQDFSHLHVLCVENNSRLIQISSKADYSLIKNGIIILENTISGSALTPIDIKPYLPSEDKIETSQHTEGDRYILLEKNNKISFCGEIRNTHGEIYLQYNDPNCLPQEISEYSRIFWWFNKFEDRKYRRILQCNPPYESDEKKSDDKLGVFACRAPIRPTPIAITNVRVTKIDRNLGRIYVNGIEGYDHTPFLGIVGYDSEADSFEREGVSLPNWAEDWPDTLDLRDSLEKTLSINEIADSLDSIQTSKPDSVLNSVNNSKEETTGKEADTEAEDGAPWTVHNSRPTHIVVKGAREHNLKDISVSIPYNAITAVVGVSGSGKSSLVMDTVYAECHRRMEYLSSTNASTLRPDMDSMSGCIPTVMISQKEIKGNSNSTIGTFSGIYNHLRSIYAAIGEKNFTDANQVEFKITPSTFSFLDPESRCSFCNGKGRRHMADTKKIIARPEISLFDGASPFLGKLKSFIEKPNANWMKGQVVALAKEMNVDLVTPWNELSEEFRNLVLNGDESKTVTFSFDNKHNGRKGDINRTLEGIIPTINRLYVEDDKGGISEKYMSEEVCSICHGERLGPVGRLTTVLGVRYPIAAKMSFAELIAFVSQLKSKLAPEKLELIEEQTNSIMEICVTAKKLGIEYLDLARETSQISGGEAQRLKLLSAFLNHMTGILYIFDEPSKKLSSREYGYITDMMKSLIAEGNTILMVEHNMDMIRIADYVIEIGPNAGTRGGYLIGEGSCRDILSHGGTMIAKYADTADFFDRKHQRNLSEFVSVEEISVNTLKNVTATFPKNAMTCITGVSGSGKSSLLYGGILDRMERSSDFSQVILVESKISGGTSRSVVATYSGIMDDLRAIFASTDGASRNNYSDSDFSFNKGKLRCEHCKGDGREKIPFTEDSYRPCPVCHGTRYSREAMKIKWNNYSIADFLNMSIDEIIEIPIELTEADSRLFNQILDKCRLLSRVGLGYITLSQSTSTLSGGEAARLKIASCLMGTRMNNALLLLDEPTCGLHFSDIDNLISLLYEIIDSGNTVVAIEHNRRFLSAADYTIVMGPGSGDKGGEIVRVMS